VTTTSDDKAFFATEQRRILCHDFTPFTSLASGSVTRLDDLEARR
jgi:hypothetical protein